jgi:hypothetical protein
MAETALEIKMIDKTMQLQPTPFKALAGRLPVRGSRAGERSFCGGGNFYNWEWFVCSMSAPKTQSRLPVNKH